MQVHVRADKRVRQRHVRGDIGDGLYGGHQVFHAAQRQPGRGIHYALLHVAYKALRTGLGGGQAQLGEAGMFFVADIGREQPVSGSYRGLNNDLQHFEQGRNKAVQQPEGRGEFEQDEFLVLDGEHLGDQFPEEDADDAQRQDEKAQAQRRGVALLHVQIVHEHWHHVFIHARAAGSRRQGAGQRYAQLDHGQAGFQVVLHEEGRRRTWRLLFL